MHARKNLKFCSINRRFHTGRVLRFARLRVFDELVPSCGDRKNYAGWSGLRFCGPVATCRGKLFETQRQFFKTFGYQFGNVESITPNQVC